MKSLIDFESSQPFATRFFTQALKGDQMVNAYILRGKDLALMYRMILRLAQIINCANKPGPAQACGQCQSCRWIEDNAHPGIMTVTNMTYLLDLDPETGTSKSRAGKAQKSIAVGQLDSLLNELSLHSGGFHRVVILAGAQEGIADEENTMPFPPPGDWKQTHEETPLQLLPLDRKLFPPVLANKFLKTLEEPPQDSIFFLLTDAEEKLLETVISRCQTVPFVTPSDFYTVDLPTETLEAFGQLMADTRRQDYWLLSQRFGEYFQTSGATAIEALTRFQHYLWLQLKRAEPSEYRFLKAKGYIRHVEHAKTMLDDRVREDAVLEDLFLKLLQV